MFFSSVIDRTSRKNISKDKDLENCIHQLALIENNRLLYSQSAEHTFFSNAHEFFTCLDPILGH